MAGWITSVLTSALGVVCATSARGCAHVSRNGEGMPAKCPSAPTTATTMAIAMKNWASVSVPKVTQVRANTNMQ